MKRKRGFVVDYVSGTLAAEKFFYASVAFFASAIAPYSTIIWSLFMFIVIDFITGVWAAKRMNCEIQSKKVKDTIWKFGFSLICIYCASRIDLHIGASGTLSVANGFCVLIIGNEFYSVLENMYKITGQRIYYILTQFTLGKIKDTTGQDLTKGKENEEN